MDTDSEHVPAMQLWGYSSGTANLTDTNFEHLLSCFECQWLLDQFVRIVDSLPPATPGAAA